MNVVLLVLLVWLFNVLVHQAFRAYANCDYLIVTRLKMDPFFCEGYTVQVLGSPIFTIPGLKGVMDPPLEFVRSVVTWSVLLILALVSLYLTIIIDNLKTVVKLLTFNKDEWKKFMTSARIWLFLFLGFCSVLYFMAIARK